MNRILAFALLSLAMGLAILATSQIPSKGQSESPTLVMEIPIEGTIEMGLAPFVARAVAEASAEGAGGLLFRVDTFGGRVDAAVRIRDTILQSELPTVVWVQGRAISAGALITLAAETVVLNEGASIGAATPVQLAPGGESQPTGEKTVSYFRGEMRATAEARGRNPQVAEAMVDPDIEIEEVSLAGKLLTLTSQEALELGIADHVVRGRQQLLEVLGWEDAKVIEAEPNWSEQLVRFLTNPVFAGLLLSLGGLALLLELRTPGLGLPGLIALICFALFFGSHYLVNLAGKVEIILFLVGLILIILEIFVIPGFGVAGILGTLMVLAGLLLSRVAPYGGTADFTGALVLLIISFAATLFLFILTLKFLPKAPWAPGIVLESVQDHGEGFHADDHEGLVQVGQLGICLTDLRPAGMIDLDGQRLDVITSGEYIDRDSQVRVIEVKANRIVVELSREEKA